MEFDPYVMYKHDLEDCFVHWPNFDIHRRLSISISTANVHALNKPTGKFRTQIILHRFHTPSL